MLQLDWKVLMVNPIISQGEMAFLKYTRDISYSDFIFSPRLASLEIGEEFNIIELYTIEISTIFV